MANLKFQQTTITAGGHQQAHINYDGVPITPSASPLPDGKCDAIAFVATTRGVVCNLVLAGLINNSDGTQTSVTSTGSSFLFFYGTGQPSGPVVILPVALDYVTTCTPTNGTCYALYVSKR